MIAHRLRAATLAATAIAVALCAPPARAATIGNLAPVGTPAGCASCTFLQRDVAPTSPSYLVPEGAWTVTDWSASGGHSEGTARLAILRPTGDPGRYLVAARSEPETVPASRVGRFATEIGVVGGDVVGLQAGADGNVPGISPGSDGDVTWALSGDPGAATTVGAGTPFPATPLPSTRVNVLATLRQDTTPPETSITKRPRNRTRKYLHHYRFVSSDPDALFECKLDRHAYRPCLSPHKVQPKRGRHRFRVRAADTAGNVDPTPASDRFKIVGRRFSRR